MPDINYTRFTLFFFLLFFLFLSACTSSVQHNRTHPLENKIWSVQEQQFITPQQLQNRLLKADIILLGETHDNPQHHRLQARVIQWFIQNKQRPAIAFEMLDQVQQNTIDQFQSTLKTSALDTKDIQTISNEFAQAIEWEKSGWPEWPLYQVVFEPALRHHLPIIATNLNVKQVRKVIKQGETVLKPRYQKLLKQYPYPNEVRKNLEQDIQSSHCDMLPEKMLAPMLKGQQVRDLAMMSALSDTLKQSNKVIMIAGSGHTRKDYGLPWYLKQEHHTTQKPVISLAFAEISQDKLKPAEYAQAWGDNLNQLPFDYVWFTQRAEREDQCEKMKAYMQKKKSVKR